MEVWTQRECDTHFLMIGLVLAVYSFHTLVLVNEYIQYFKFIKQKLYTPVCIQELIFISYFAVFLLHIL